MQVLELNVLPSKLLRPIETGILRFNRNGASTGSGAMYNSTMMNPITVTIKMPSEVNTLGAVKGRSSLYL